jgi:hypothetical protein
MTSDVPATPIHTRKFMLVTLVVRSTMRGTSPPPIVPEISTTEERTTEPGTTSDGGDRSLSERTFGAPLVPDCS